MTLAHAEFQSDFQLPAVGGFHYRGYGGMLQMILYTAVLGRMKFSQMDGFCGAISLVIFQLKWLGIYVSHGLVMQISRKKVKSQSPILTVSFCVCVFICARGLRNMVNIRKQMESGIYSCVNLGDKMMNTYFRAHLQRKMYDKLK